MIVSLNGISYALENRLIKKLDLMIRRVTQDKPAKDAVLINEGGEGEGKSNSSIAEAGYIKSKTGRPIHLFFRVEEMLHFAQTTEKKTIIWDEPSLDSLSTDQLNNLNKDLIRLFMTVRKKRHFFIINLTKFWKFSEYVVVDRGLGLIHMYSRKEIEPGRFVYVKKKRLEQLWNDHAQKKKRNYNKLKSFSGSFPEIMEKCFDAMDITVMNKPHATLQDYEDEKDKSIGSIGVKKSKAELKIEAKLNGLRYRVVQIFKKGALKQADLAKLLEVEPVRLREWAKIPLEKTDLLGKLGFEPTTETNIITNGGNQSSNPDVLLVDDENDDDFDDNGDETEEEELIAEK